MQAPERKKEPTWITVVGIVLFVAAFVIAFLYVIIPAASNLYVSPTKYNAFQGLLGSPFIGLDNYLKLLTDKQFTAAFGTTLGMSFGTGLMLLALSAAVGYLLLATGRQKWLRHTITTLLLLPLVAPPDLWALAYIKLFGAGSTLLVELWDTLKFVGLPALLVSAAAAAGKQSWTVPLLSGGIVSLVFFAFLGRLDFGFLFLVARPASMSLDTYVFRSTFMYMQIGWSTAACVIRSVMSACLLAAAAYPVVVMARRLFRGGAPADAGVKDRLLSLILPLGIAVIAAAALAVLGLSKGLSEMETRLYENLPIFIALAFAAAIANTILCYMLAQRVACGKTKAGRVIPFLLLMLLTVLQIAPVTYGEYMIFQRLNALNTYVPVFLSGLCSVWGAWVLVFAAKAYGIGSGMEWHKRMWKPSLALIAAQTIQLTNNTFTSFVYLSKADLSNPVLLLAREAQGQAHINIALLALAAMALPVFLLLVIRTVFNEKDNLSLFLPGR